MCTLCTLVHFVESCAPLHTCFFKIWFIRKFMKFKYKHHIKFQLSSLADKKSQGKCALCAPCALLCTTVHPCTPVFSKMWFIRKLMKFKFKHPYQISELQHNRQKSQGKCALCVHPVRPCAPLYICFFQNMVYKKVDEI